MKNKDQPAFGYGFVNEQAHQEVTGLSKREYFAGLAMQGILAGNYRYLDGNIEFPVTDLTCQLAVEFADNLLEQLEYEIKK